MASVRSMDSPDLGNNGVVSRILGRNDERNSVLLAPRRQIFIAIKRTGSTFIAIEFDCLDRPNLVIYNRYFPSRYPDVKDALCEPSRSVLLHDLRSWKCFPDGVEERRVAIPRIFGMRRGGYILYPLRRFARGVLYLGQHLFRHSEIVKRVGGERHHTRKSARE